MNLTSVVCIFLYTFSLGHTEETEVRLAYHPNAVTATGGGIVANGQDLVLTYFVGPDDKSWVTCKWIRYVPSDYGDDGTSEYCLFADLPIYEGGTVTKLKCKPNDFMETNQMEYVGVSKSECSIKIRNASMDDSTVWGVALNSDYPKRINVTIARPMDSVAQVIYPDSFVPGERNFVSCTVIGGSPIPRIMTTYGTASDNSILEVDETSRSQLTTMIENGKYKTVYNYTIIPQARDHGRTIDCVATQYDKAEPPQVLFKDTQGTDGLLSANQLTINIQKQNESKVDMVYLRTYGWRDNTCSEQNFEAECKIICDGSTQTEISGNYITCSKAGNNVTLYNANIMHNVCGECNYGIINPLYEIVVCDSYDLNLGDGMEGDWSDWEFCSSNTYVNGFTVKTYDTNCWGDCAGVTDIKLKCSDPTYPKNQKDKSTLHPNDNETYGIWEESKYCETGFIVGGALEYFEDSDDYGVTNVQMVCGTQNGPKLNGSPKSSDWTLGTWHDEFVCDKGFLICGMQVRIEKNQGFWGDDSGLNGIRLKCCKSYM